MGRGAVSTGAMRVETNFRRASGHWAASRNRTLQRHRRCPRLSISPCVL